MMTERGKAWKSPAFWKVNRPAPVIPEASPTARPQRPRNFQENLSASVRYKPNRNRDNGSVIKTNARCQFKETE